ncbi:mitotic spindle assembly checkpoint protein MAD1-like [Ptychodera flava]|uniref:mitotic spindle assembly checkpoint protein MAD1-like n=1 Tax=Ptychodera flava TaxID=63121 RepID=UPI00396AA696
MNSPEDSTAVVRIMGEFKDYINKDIEKRRMENMMREKEAEILAARSNVTILESEVEDMKTEFQRQQLEYEKDLEKMKLERQRDKEKVTEMQHKMEFLARQEQRARQECEEYKKLVEKDKVHFKEKTQEMRQETLRLQSQLHEAEEIGRTEASLLRNELLKRENKIKQLKLDVEQSKAELQHSMRRAVEAAGWKGQVRQYQEQALAAEQVAKELKHQVLQLEEGAVVANAMKDSLGKLKELEKENRRLQEENKYFRETNENTTLLKERCKGMESKLNRAEQRMAEMSRLQIENEALQERLKKWETSDTDGTGKPRSPYEFNRQIAELQQQNALLLANASSPAFEQAYQATASKLSQTGQQLIELQEKHKQQEDLVKRLQRRCLLVTKERDSLRQVLNEYDSEVTTTSSNSQYITRMQQAEETLQTANRHIERLEQDMKAAVEDGSNARVAAKQHELKIGQLEMQIHALSSAKESGATPASSRELQDLKDRIQHLEEENVKLAERNENLEAIFEQRAIQGDFDPTKTKVVHFGMNPSAMARQKRAEELNQLREECEILRNRVRELEESGASIGGEKMSEKFAEMSSKEVEDLKKELKSSEMRNQRLKEVFYKKIHAFREACYQLTGYKIDNPKENNYSLMSMYAESSEDVLMFQSTDAGSFQLLETTFSSTLNEMIQQHLIRFDSIPSFLSSLTLELFSRQTMVIT